MKRTIIWDGDDTLWECHPYYLAVTRKAAEYISEQTTMPLGLVEELVGHCHVLSATAHPLFAKDAFPAALRGAGAAAENIMGFAGDELFGEQLLRIGYSVYDADYAPRDGAREVLAAYQEAGWRQFLVTKGDEAVQNRKVDKNGLRDFFTGVHVVQNKGFERLRRILVDEWIEPALTVYVGDSPRDDIMPAKQNGVYAVHIPKTGGATWGYENLQAQPDASIVQLRDLLAKVPPSMTKSELLDGNFPT